MTNSDDTLSKLEAKKNEADRFARKYKARNMEDLEEYYKGASWALDFAIKTIQEETSDLP